MSADYIKNAPGIEHAFSSLARWHRIGLPFLVLQIQIPVSSEVSKDCPNHRRKGNLRRGVEGMCFLRCVRNVDYTGGYDHIHVT